MDFIPQLKAAYPLLDGRWPTRPDEVLASEPLTVRLGVKVGQTLALSGEQGPRQFTVTGVYQDYGSDKGQILHAFEAGAVQSLALFSDDPEQLADRLRERFGEQLNLLSAPAIHSAALKVFDQTFVVTELLKLLILGIALCRIGSAFMVLGLARRGELQTLQSLGLSPRHCRQLLVWQGAGIGAAHRPAGPAGGLWPRLGADRGGQPPRLWLAPRLRGRPPSCGHRPVAGAGLWRTGILVCSKESGMKQIKGWPLALGMLWTLYSGTIAASDLGALLGGGSDSFKKVQPGQTIQLPEDHAAHPRLPLRVVVSHRQPQG